MKMSTTMGRTGGFEKDKNKKQHTKENIIWKGHQVDPIKYEEYINTSDPKNKEKIQRLFEE